jgi:uroporphyrinogen decarboxylase
MKRVREETLRALRHEDTARPPFDSIGSAAYSEAGQVVAGLDLPAEVREWYRQGEFRYLQFGVREERERFRDYLPGLPAEARLSEWGVGSVDLKTAEGYHAGHFDYRPLAEVDTIAELEAFPFPDMTEPWRHEGLEEEVSAAKAEEYTVVGQMSQTTLETAYCMRGIERLFTDFYERPEYVEVLFEKIAAQRRFQARRFAEAGVDVLRIGDDIATQAGLLVGPPLYRERLKPFHASVVAAGRAVNPSLQVLYHSDGKLTGLLPDLIEVGVTAINPVQPECMDSRETKREFGRDLVLWGCCPVQSTYAFGSREDIITHVGLLKGPLAVGGGLVAQFYNMILTPKVKENLATFFETFYR